MSVASLADRFRPGREAAVLGGGLLAAELVAVATYLLFADVVITDPLILVYPLVWINVGLWAVWRTDPPAAGRRRRLAVGAGAAAYLGVLAVVGGVVSLAPTGGVAPSTGLRVAYATVPPGIGPAVFYAGESITLALLPYQIVGYVALAYLVYATVLEAAGSALSGLLGLFACVSCVWPVLGMAIAGVFGSGSAVYAFAMSQSFGLSTLVFVTAVALLRWRPTV